MKCNVMYELKNEWIWDGMGNFMTEQPIQEDSF